jgi:hypothetical protein
LADADVVVLPPGPVAVRFHVKEPPLQRPVLGTEPEAAAGKYSPVAPGAFTVTWVAFLVAQLTVTSFGSPSLAHVTRPGDTAALVNVGFGELPFDPLLLPELDDPLLPFDPPDPDWPCPFPLELVVVVVDDCDDALVPVPPPHAASVNIPTLTSATEAAIPRRIPALPSGRPIVRVPERLYTRIEEGADTTDLTPRNDLNATELVCSACPPDALGTLADRVEPSSAGRRKQDADPIPSGVRRCEYFPAGVAGVGR